MHKQGTVTWLASIGAFLLDMDGTTVLGDRLLPGVMELIDFFHDQRIRYLFLTNNSSRDRATYCERLRSHGLDVSERHILTSGDATAVYLNARMPGVAVFLVGTPQLEAEFRRAGIQLAPAKESEAIVVAFDTTITYKKLKEACDLVRLGLPYLATHPDVNCPTEGGFIPDVGAVLAFVEASTGRRPDHIIGKPHQPIVDAVLQRLELPADRVCMVGDRLYTDIALGQYSLRTILVLSGETGLEDLGDTPFVPDLVLEDIQALLNTLHSE